MTLESSKKSDGVTIKGSPTGLLIRLRDEQDQFPFQLLIQDLAERLRQSDKFFQHARTSIDLGKREIDSNELEQIQGLLGLHGIELERIISGSNTTRSAARQLGVEYKLPSSQNTRPPASIERDSAGVPFDSAEALFVRRTLRSGQEVRHHGDVCLLGDVNPGAKIVAGGSIVVWGVVRGVVEAGALNSKTAQSATVCALQLTPSILRIGEVVARAPEVAPRYNGPEIALVRNGAIVVEPWSPKKF
jgi:septum site-determining protein MinC